MASKEEDKAKEASKALGGMSGAAARAISGRGRQIDAEVDKATGTSPNQNSDKGVDGNGRPEQRKRWYE